MRTNYSDNGLRRFYIADRPERDEMIVYIIEGSERKVSRMTLDYAEIRASIQTDDYTQ